MDLGKTILSMGFKEGRISFVLCMLAGITLFAPLINGGTTHYPVFFIRFALILTGAAVLIEGMKRGEIAIPRDPLLLLALVLFGLATLSLVWAPYTSGALQWVLSLASYVLFYALLLRGIVTDSHARMFALGLCMMGIGEALLGAVQYLWLGYARSQGTFFNPNFFATYVSAIFSIALSLLVFPSRTVLSSRETLLLWSTVGATGLAFVLAQSRGAVLALLCAVGVVGLTRFGKRFGLALAVLLAVLILVPNPIRQRALQVSSHDPYAYTRLDIWTSSLQRIVDNPFGVGAGMFQYTSFAYRFPLEQDVARFGKRAESAHNEYLQLTVELGIVGMLVVAVGVAVWIRNVRALLRQSLAPWERGMVTGLVAGMAGILAHAAVDSLFHEPALMLLLTLMGGMVFAIQGLSVRSPAHIRIPFAYRSTTLTLVLSGTVLAVFLVARPAAAWCAFEAGEQAYRAGRISEAMTAFVRAAAIDPGVTGYHDAVARVQVRAYEQSGDLRWLTEAMEELQIGRSLNGQDARFPARLGMLQLVLAQRSSEASEQAQHMAKAAAYYEQAIALDPYTPSNYYESAKVHLAQNNQDEARRLLKEAVTYEPNFLPARALLAELAVRTGDSAVARAEYESIVAVQARFSGRPLNALEREFLDVDANRIGKLVVAQPAS